MGMGETHFSLEIAKIREIFESRYSDRVWMVFIEGPLGAGKTTFVKEWLAQWGFDPVQVHSPTFLKLLEYRLPHSQELVVHIDAYRLEEFTEVEALSLEGYADRVKVFFVEWPELFEKYLNERKSVQRIFEPRALVRVKMDVEGDRRNVFWEFEES